MFQMNTVADFLFRRIKYNIEYLVEKKREKPVDIRILVSINRFVTQVAFLS